MSSNSKTRETKTRLQHGKFSAWVLVDEKELQCNAIDFDRKGREMTCWVPSEVGKNFQIIIKKEDSTRFPCRVQVSLDGHHVWQKSGRGKETFVWKIATLKTSDTTERPFMFAPLEVTDDINHLETSLLSASNTNRSLGEISVKINRLENYKIVREKVKCQKDIETVPTNAGSQAVEENIPKPHIVHEQSEKARNLSHQVTYGEILKVEPLCAPEFYPGAKKKGWRYEERKTYSISNLVISFKFIYRAQAQLLQNGLAPREQVIGLRNSDARQNPIMINHEGISHSQSASTAHSLSGPTAPLNEERTNSPPRTEDDAVQPHSPASAGIQVREEEFDDMDMYMRSSEEPDRRPPVSVPPPMQGASSVLSLSETRVLDNGATEEVDIKPFSKNAGIVKYEENGDKDEDEDAQDERIRSLMAALQKELDNKKKRKKVLESESPGPSSKKVKKEVKKEVDSNHRFFEQGEVIDLTSD